MMELEFSGSKELTELKIDSQKYNSCISELSSAQKQQMMDMLTELTEVLPGPYRLVVDGELTNYPGLYISEKKMYAYKMDDARRALAVFIHNPDNMRLYWDRVVPEIRNLIKLILRNGPVFMEVLKELGLDDYVAVIPPRYKYDQTLYVVRKHSVWFRFETCYERGDARVYLRLHRGFIRYAYLPGLPYEHFSDQLPDGLESRVAEAEALIAVPLVDSLRSQDALKTQGCRVTELSAWKNKDAVPIPEILPDCGAKVTIARTLFSISYLLADRYWKGTPQDVLKHHYEFLSRMTGDYLFPILLPYVKGFRAQSISYSSLSSITWLLSVLRSSGRRWVLLEAIDLKTFINDEFSLRPGLLQSLDLEDTVMGRRVTPADVVYVNQSLLRSFCAAMFGLGMLELGMTTPQENTLRPYEHIQAVRLTALGRYAMGLEMTYEPPEMKHEPLFELDEKRLIIRSLQPGNTYESLLYDTAQSIGNARYKLSPESFLASCKNSADVERKVCFFKQYISEQLPPVWEEFFKSIMHRCNPLKKDKTDYEIFTISSENEELLRLLVSDTTLRSLIIRAEGYRILVPVKNKTAFVNRLKTFGYLV